MRNVLTMRIEFFYDCHARVSVIKNLARMKRMDILTCFYLENKRIIEIQQGLVNNDNDE